MNLLHIFASTNKLNPTKIMEDSNKSNVFAQKSANLTLKGYYKSLPDPTYPKKEFVSMIAEKCNVTIATANNWIKYGIRPNNPEHVRILSEITGIPPENLWF